MSGKPLYDRDVLVPQICERLAKGEPLTSICRDLGIDRKTVNNWRNQDENIGKEVQAARDEGYDAIADDCLRIADDNQGDYKLELRGREEVVVIDKEAVMRSKLRVETRLKLLAKWDPKRYGEKVEHEHQGGITVHLDATDSAL